MQTYIAHYISPAAADVRGTGLFEFESDSRANTKGNLRVERKKASVASQDGQLALDFRPPKPERKRAKKKEYW